MRALVLHLLFSILVKADSPGRRILLGEMRSHQASCQPVSQVMRALVTQNATSLSRPSRLRFALARILRSISIGQGGGRRPACRQYDGRRAAARQRAITAICAPCQQTCAPSSSPTTNKIGRMRDFRRLQRDIPLHRSERRPGSTSSGWRDMMRFPR